MVVVLVATSPLLLHCTHIAGNISTYLLLIDGGINLYLVGLFLKFFLFFFGLVWVFLHPFSLLCHQISCFLPISSKKILF